MIKKLICGIMILICLFCSSTHDFVRVKASDSYFIDNWKRNGIKIIHIDTVKTIRGIEYHIQLE